MFWAPEAQRARYHLMQSHRPPQHRSVIEVYVGPEDRPKTYARGRRCTTCKAVLSIYNSGHQCWACHPRGRTLHRYGGGEPTPDKLDFAELMEDAA